MTGDFDDLVDQALSDIERDYKDWAAFLKCPTCGAEQGKPCRTPKGRRKLTPHDTRRFNIILS